MWALGALGCLACTADPAVPPEADAAPPGLLDATPLDAALPDGPIPDLRPPRDARYDAAPPEDAGPSDRGVVDSAVECVEGAARCAEAPVDGLDLQVCRGGRWQARACGAGQVCLADRCLPDPAGCVDGAAVCWDPQTPAACDPAIPTWAPAAPCDPGARCRAGRCEPTACADAADAGSYLGCAFLSVPLPNFAQIYTPGTPMGLVLANPGDGPVAVTVTGPGGQPAALLGQFVVTLSDDPLVPALAPDLYPPETVRSAVRGADGVVVAQGFERAVDQPVPAGGTATFLLPPAGPETLTSGVFDLAWRVTSTGPVAAYQFSPFCCNFSFSNDASLLYPEAALGQVHRVVGAPVFVFEGQAAPATVAVAAPPGGAQVTVTLPPGARVRPDPQQRLAQLANDTWQADLAGQQVLLLQVDDGDPGDPTGARVVSDAPVAVFSSHLCTFVPQSTGFCDHLESQLPPVDAWGRRYALVPPPARGRSGADQVVWWRMTPDLADPEAAPVTVQLSRPLADLPGAEPLSAGSLDCRALATDDRTLRLDGPCTLATAAPLGLVADAPLLVMGLLGGQDRVQADSPFGTRSGDPSLFLVPPDRQLRRDYVFLVPGTYALDFVTVVAPADARLALDGVPVDLAGAAPVPGTARVFVHLPLSDGAHRLTGDAPFAIRVTAFDDFVSYALTGGLDLRKP